MPLYYLYGLIPIGIAATVYFIRKIREWQWGWVRQTYSLKDKIFIITGANTGLGYEAAKDLVTRDGTVIMACRNQVKAEEAIAKIRQKTANGKLIFIELDLASFESIHKFVKEILQKYRKFDCLINNAGVATNLNHQTVEKFEINFGVNHLGHFLLTNLLLDTIKANSSRIVIVSSMLHQCAKIDFENLGKPLEQQLPVARMNPLYNSSKLANFYFARELYKKGFDVHVLCPGLCHTDIFRDYNPRWYHYILFSPVVWLALRSARQGAQNIVHCATDSKNTTEQNPATGFITFNVKPRKSQAHFDELTSQKLWKESETLCNIANNTDGNNQMEN